MALYHAQIIHDTTKWKISRLISLHVALMWVQLAGKHVTCLTNNLMNHQSHTLES